MSLRRKRTLRGTAAPRRKRHAAGRLSTLPPTLPAPAPAPTPTPAPAPAPAPASASTSTSTSPPSGGGAGGGAGAVASTAATTSATTTAATTTASAVPPSAFDAEFGALTAADIESDVLIALRLLRSQFPQLVPYTRKAALRSDETRSIVRIAPFPIILRTQLVATIGKTTSTTQSLSELVNSEPQVVRLVQLPTGSDDVAIVFNDDFVGWVQRRIKQCQDADQQGDADTLQRFLKLLPQCRDTLVTQRTLLTKMPDFKQADVSCLVKHGLLTRATTTRSHTACYDFAIPKVITITSPHTANTDNTRHPLQSGLFMDSIKKGRREMAQMLKRTRYKEMSDRTLRQRKLRRSPLGVGWHIRDMIGAGFFEVQETGTGRLYQLSRSKTPLTPK